MKYNPPFGSTDPNASYVDKNVPGAVRGSAVPALAIEQPQREIVDVISKAGLAPNNGLQLWDALKFLGLSGALRSRRWANVISMTLNAPPAEPAEGDLYLVAAAPTGAWAGNAGKIAEWSGLTWSFFSPSDGHGISLPDGRVFERVNGAYVEKLALDAQSGKWNFAVAAGAANAITATLTPAPAAYVDGMQFRLKAAATNTQATPTMALNGLAAKQIVNPDGSALTPGSIVAGTIQTYGYDATLDKIVLVTAANTGVKQGTGWIRHSDGTYEAWGQVTFNGTTTQVDVTLPVTFPVSIDSVLISDTNSGVYPGAGYPLNTSSLRCFTQAYVINPNNGQVQQKSTIIVLWYRCWGK